MRAANSGGDGSHAHAVPKEPLRTSQKRLSSYGIDHVETFSGGLEVTAFNPRALAAVGRAGVQVTNPGGDNPHVKVTYANDRACCAPSAFPADSAPIRLGRKPG